MSHSTDDGPGPEVGSLAEETARLLDALEGWTHRRGKHDQSDGPEHATDPQDHSGSSSGDCRVCPLCRGAQLMRSVTPEVRDHLNSAVGSLLQAAAAMVAAHAPDSEPAEPRVQHIDLDADIDLGNATDGSHDAS